MSILNDTAICLRCWDFSETSQTVSLLTKQHGIIRGLAKGSRRDNAGFSGGFDPLTRGNIVARLKPSKELITLTEWNLEHVWWTTRNNLEVNRGAIYLIDLVGRMITDQDPHSEVLDALQDALNRMDDGHDIDWPLLRFQWSLLVETGYQPTLTTDSEHEPIVAFCSRIDASLRYGLQCRRKGHAGIWAQCHDAVDTCGCCGRGGWSGPWAGRRRRAW